MTVLETRDLNPEQRRELICQMKIVNKTRTRQCEHIKTNESSAARPHCVAATTATSTSPTSAVACVPNASARRPRPWRVDPGVVPLELPPLEDANSVQMALMQVIDAILHNRIDNKRAGLVLYALQTASSTWLAPTSTR